MNKYRVFQLGSLKLISVKNLEIFETKVGNNPLFFSKGEGKTSKTDFLRELLPKYHASMGPPLEIVPQNRNMINTKRTHGDIETSHIECQEKITAIPSS